MKHSISFFTIIIISLTLTSCSTPQDCPTLDFDPVDRLTTVDDKLYTGRCITYRNGIKRSIQQYVNGVDYGKWQFYYPDGTTETKGKFKNGTRVGKWKYYYPNGKIMQVSRYSNDGKRKGKWVVYDTIGNISSITKY